LEFFSSLFHEHFDRKVPIKFGEEIIIKKRFFNMANQIKTFGIYPPLGISRIGNSDEYFLASDVPGKAPVVENGYKDNKGRIKKQVSRFRIYGLDEAGKVVKEITANDGASITWRVHVANRKAAWYQFINALDMGPLSKSVLPRNAAEILLRQKNLVIDPGPKEITGKNVQGVEYQLTGGQFRGTEVPLGEIRTDDDGRLLVFGGNGNSASCDGSRAFTFANNDNWHDDISDGTVRATIHFEGNMYEAEPAMVAVVPPNFGPGLFGITTMYDVVLDLFIRSGWVAAPEKINFWEHVYPVLERTVSTQWVNGGFYMLFGHNSPCDFTSPLLLNQLSTPGDENEAVRKTIAGWYRNPSATVFEPEKFPPVYGDAIGEYSDIPNVHMPITQTQYAWMQQWAEGNFVSDKPVDTAFDRLAPGEQVAALTRAPLEECLGGPFHPGIELTWPFRNLMMWEKPFRLKILPEGIAPKDDYGPLLTPDIALGNEGPLDGSGPGSLTRWLGVPWQTDEASCLYGYAPSLHLALPSFWAARVPNNVLSENSYMRLTDPQLNIGQRLKHLDYRQDWLRDLGTQFEMRINNMIAKWNEMGVIMNVPIPEHSEHELLPDQLWVESDRGPFDKDDPTFKQVLVVENPDDAVIDTAAKILIKISGIDNAQDRPTREYLLHERNER
jgi:L-Lysine epsilon oxidase N-terminal/L-lysine epsilon oxidase C-terminal domain